MSLAECYRLREQVISVGSLRLNLWSTRGVDDLITDDTDPDEMPYWAELWPSAVALARWLASLRELADRSVLELGCGTGLPSIAAALNGARVTATDYVDDALSFAKANAEINGASNMEFVLYDWRHPLPLGGFDIVIGADILYERKLHEHLSRILEETVSEDGLALIADPCRPAAVDFLAKMEDDGWHVSVAEDNLPGMVHELVMLYTLTRQ